MKYIFLCLTLFTTVFTSCSDDTGLAPVITVDSVYVDGKRIIELTPIARNSVVNIFASLKAEEGTSLTSFNVKAECIHEKENTKNLSSPSECSSYIATSIKGQGNNEHFSLLSDSTTYVRFKDNVVKTCVEVKTELTFPVSKDERTLELLFGLNASEQPTESKITFTVLPKTISELEAEKEETDKP